MQPYSNNPGRTFKAGSAIRQLLTRAFRALSRRTTEQPLLRYARRAGVARLGEALISPEESGQPIRLDATAKLLWDYLERPRTRDELVGRLVEAGTMSLGTARRLVQLFLDGLSAEGILVVARGPANATNDSSLGMSTSSILAAYERGAAGDWQSALTLCLAAREDVEHTAFVELNVLICLYHLGGRMAEVCDRALGLLPQFPVAAKLSCLGLAMASGYEAGDLERTKKVACVLARLKLKPWDMPTIPTFVYTFGGRVVEIEGRGVEDQIRMIEEVQARCVNTPDETALLTALAQQYRER
jgi:hypothetical protein